MKYRAEIDGLRALAVIPVILFHAGFELFSGGFIGVDIFFVISGYLITTILIEDIENKRFNIVNFYERRARRILPALFFVMLCSIPFAWTVMDPFELKEFSQSLSATSLFSSNIYFYMKTGYFDISSEIKPLLHTWSLAVEEQYYVLFPIFLFLFWRFGKKSIFWMIVVFATISLALSEWGWRNAPTANFYLAPTRVWELLAGSIVTFIVQKRGKGKNDILALLGLSSIIFSIFVFNESTPFPSFYALIPVIGVVLLLLYADKETLVAKLLSTKLLVGIGLISYSAYLWHHPALAFYRIYFLKEPNFIHACIILIFTLSISLLSYRYIEQPFRASKKFGRTAVFSFALIGIISFGLAGFVGHLEKGFPDRNPNLSRLAQNGGISFDCSGAPLELEACKTNSNPRVILWGDSFAMHLGKPLASIFNNEGLWQMTLSACPPVPGYTLAPRKAAISCEHYNQMVFDYLINKGKGKHDILIISSSMNLFNISLKSKFKDSISKLKETGIAIVIISPTVKHKETNRCIKLQMRKGNDDLSNCSFPFKDAQNHMVFDELKQLASDLKVFYIDLSKMQCTNNGICDIWKKNTLLLRDIGHLANESSYLVADFIKIKLEKAKVIH